jgi:hypothetical protein
MRCIYCLESDRPGVGVPHVLPEAVGKNQLQLPRGAVCDPCNQYLGSLDKVLAKHPLVSLGAQLLQIPGKRGKLRSRIGTVGQLPSERAISIPVRARPIPSTAGSEWEVTPLIDREFDDFRFRRALHHVGLNVIAYLDGVEGALDVKYNDVRRYIRKPSNMRERWGFAQLPLFDAMSRELKLLREDTPEGMIVTMRLFGALFCVDLTNSGVLIDFVDKMARVHRDLRYYGPSEGIDRELYWDGVDRYQVLIDIDQ